MNEENQVQDRYRVFDVTVTSMDKGKALVASMRSKKPRIFGPSELQLLLSCQKFDTLCVHAEQYYRQRMQQLLTGRKGLLGKLFRWVRHYASPQDIKLPVDKKEINHYQQQLQEWVEKGFLISESEMQQQIEALSYLNSQGELAPGQISIVGIPTCGRPETLKRCLKSFTDNFNRHSRNPDILVFDDSRNEKDQQQNQSILQGLNSKYRGNFFYMNRRQRADFGQAVARMAKADPAVMDFALMGHPCCNRSEGGCRNAFLLLSQGRLALQTDDDTICRIARPPTVMPQLRLTSEASSDAYWFFDTYEEAIQAVDFLDHDFLGCHEKFLGKDVKNLIAHFLNNGSSLDIEKLNSSFFHNMKNDNSIIRMSLIGPVGDSCLFTDLYRLFLEGDSLNRLLYPRKEYAKRLATRQVIRSVPQPTISNFSRCIGMNFAVDNRSLLPPFMPVQARCDGIFGDLLQTCFPWTFTNYLAYVLSHNPPEKRSRTMEEVFTLHSQIRINDIIAELIYDFKKRLYVEDPAENLKALGKFFMSVGNSSRDDFQQLIYQMYASRISSKIRVTEQYLSQKTTIPQYWIDSMQRYIEGMSNSLLSNDFQIPTDIDNSTIHGRDDFKNIISLFGRLLSNWPDIYQAMDQFSRDDIVKYVTPIDH